MRAMSWQVSHGRDETGESLMAIATRNAGPRRAIQALTFIAAWDTARRGLVKRPLTLAEYGEWWRLSESTMYREQARFREAFPGESTPDRLLDLIQGQAYAHQGVKGLGALRVNLS
jgi:hypothetical protein